MPPTRADAAVRARRGAVHGAARGCGRERAGAWSFRAPEGEAAEVRRGPPPRRGGAHPQVSGRAGEYLLSLPAPARRSRRRAKRRASASASLRRKKAGFQKAGDRRLLDAGEWMADVDPPARLWHARAGVEALAEPFGPRRWAPTASTSSTLWLALSLEPRGRRVRQRAAPRRGTHTPSSRKIGGRGPDVGGRSRG